MDSVAIYVSDPEDSGIPREAARTPLRFRDRVLAQFRTPANLAYLRGLLAGRVPAGPLRAFALETTRCSSTRAAPDARSRSSRRTPSPGAARSGRPSASGARCAG